MQSAAHNARELPDVWQHRNARRSWTGALGTEALPPQPRRQVVPSWLYVLRVLTLHDFHARYRAQALGFVWSLLNPLVMMGLLSVIFTRFMPSRQANYPIYVLTGLVVWQWFSSSVNAATGSFIHNAEIVKRTVFPRQLLPLSMVLSYAINFALESSLLFIFIPIFPSAFKLSPALVLVPVLIFWLAVLIAGVSLAVSVLNVVYRDVAYIVTTGLTLLYWLTPLIYPFDEKTIPYPYHTLWQCNPLCGILTALRGAMMLGEVPTLLGWAGILVPTLTVFGIGWLVFRHYERMVLDYV
jgi:ABC-type polysaccharide/polyol phosphate export permease